MEISSRVDIGQLLLSRGVLATWVLASTSPVVYVNQDLVGPSTVISSPVNAFPGYYALKGICYSSIGGGVWSQYPS